MALKRSMGEGKELSGLASRLSDLGVAHEDKERALRRAAIRDIEKYIRRYTLLGDSSHGGTICCHFKLMLDLGLCLLPKTSLGDPNPAWRFA